MAFCKNCGAQINDGVRFCAKCGTPMTPPAASVPPAYKPAPAPKPRRKSDFTDEIDEQDRKDNKLLAMLLYVGSILPIFAMFIEQMFAPFFSLLFIILAKVAKPESKMIHFHANQALLVVLLNLAASILGYMPFVGFWVALSVVGFSSVCIVMGMIYALRGIARDLPIIGGLRFIR